MKVSRFYADLGLLVTAVVWGATFPVIKIALDYISPFAFNSIRFFLASLLFIPFFKREGWRVGIKIGFCTFLGYSFQTVGMKFTTATNAGFITSLYVVLAPIIAYLLYRARLRLLDGLCLIIAFIGFYLLSGYEGFRIGDILILLCAVGFGTEIAMISYHSKNVNPTILAFWQILSVAIFSTPLALITTDKLTINFEFIYALIVTVLLATFVAKMFQNWFQRYVSVTEASIILSLEGVFAHIFAVVMLGESLSMVQYFGAFLITVAVILISLR
ncbi:DMT family transporter [Archaeoglobus sp.]